MKLKEEIILNRTTIMACRDSCYLGTTLLCDNCDVGFGEMVASMDQLGRKEMLNYDIYLVYLKLKQIQDNINEPDWDSGHVEPLLAIMVEIYRNMLVKLNSSQSPSDAVKIVETLTLKNLLSEDKVEIVESFKDFEVSKVLEIARCLINANTMENVLPVIKSLAQLHVPYPHS
jgi:hypothetical protein